MNPDDNIAFVELKKNISKQGMSAMLEIFRSNRDAYLAFTKRYTNDRDLRMQSFNDAIILLYRTIVKGKFDPNKSQLKTYLFTIGKNNLINKLEKEIAHKKIMQAKENNFENINYEPEKEDLKNNALKKSIDEVFGSLGEKCQSLILYFYYDALDSEEIMKLMNYDSVNVVYSAKSRCLKKLKDLIKKNSERL